jgi:hypothetical protein
MKRPLDKVPNFRPKEIVQPTTRNYRGYEFKYSLTDKECEELIEQVKNAHKKYKL